MIPASTLKLIEHPAALANVLRRIAVTAGDLTLDYFDEAGFTDVDTKSDDTPQTIADREAETLIKKELEAQIPGIPFVGEELVAAQKEAETPQIDISGHEYYWLVDPLDGTKEFISGSGEYTVNIALMHKDTPLVGVVYAPVAGELYAGFPGRAFRWLADTGSEKDIHVRQVPREGMIVVTSRSHGDAAKRDHLLDQLKVAKQVQRGSSLKICAIATGKADLYPRFGLTCEWDTAAADAVLRAAGGAVFDMATRAPLTYGGKRPGFLNPEFIAARDDFFEVYQPEISGHPMPL